MTPRLLVPVLALALVLPVLPPAAHAEVASILLQEGETLSDGQVVSGLNNTAPDRYGGYYVTLTSMGTAGTLSQVWGSPGGGPADLVRSEGTVGQWVQTSFESFFGAEYDPLADAGPLVAYSPICTDTVSGASGLDAVFMNDTPIMVETEPVFGMSGFYWSFGSRPGVTQTGDTHLIGGITNTVGGATQNRVLWFDPGSLPFEGSAYLIGGQAVPGLPQPLTTDSNALSFDYRFSKNGTHYVIEVGMQTGSTLNDNAMVVDGAAALSDGLPMIEGSPVPAASGGLPGENWDSFDNAGITEDGTWMITGDTDGDIATDEFVAVDGKIDLREGDAVGPDTLSGSIEGGYLNEDRDVAVTWDVEGGVVEALILGRYSYDALDRLYGVIVREGDPVDLDGDGIPEPNTAITDFTGISTVTMSDRDADGYVNIYFTADVDVQPVAAREAGAGAVDAAAPALASLEERGLEEETPAGEARMAVVEGFFVVRVLALDLPTSVGAPEAAPSVRFAAAPNPMTAAGTTLRFTTAREEAVSLRIFDVSGRLVRTLVDGTRGAGLHEVAWDGRDDAGRRVTGVHFARLEMEGRSESRRLLVLP